MKSYIVVQMVKATPMTLGEWAIQTSDKNDLTRADPTPGYLIEYPDGHHSWSLQNPFDAVALELDDPTKITENDLTRFVGPEPFSVGKLDDKTTVVKLTPRTGFVQYEHSSCVDPENYNQELGAQICVDRIKNKLWPMLGFVLQWAKYGLAPIQPVEETPNADSPQPA